MQITEITVQAGRTFNHPYENFSNLRPSITLKATIEAGEDPEQATKKLQAKAESVIEDHKQNMLNSLDEIHNTEMASHEIRSLESQLINAQARLDRIRKENPKLSLAEPARGSIDEEFDDDIDLFSNIDEESL